MYDENKRAIKNMVGEIKHRLIVLDLKISNLEEKQHEKTILLGRNKESSTDTRTKKLDSSGKREIYYSEFLHSLLGAVGTV